ncbi:CLIP domain-containing serine protease HP8-like [Anopheles cruzii]|uniref:CLIP domain-containing serine protease HP8-like n=1 Tax=Anopheles cruzii TaxID=68878 RepID=UPI0022EC3C12|nr:CLIP domain-containing serine protease HP8-like [Anopheles cruzii]
MVQINLSRAGTVFVALFITSIAEASWSSQGSTTTVVQNSTDLLCSRLNNEGCGKRFYDKEFPIDSRLFEHPWIVRFGYKRDDNVTYVFQGALIHELYVVTTVFVTQFDSFGRLTYVRLGEYNSSTENDCSLLSEQGETCAPPAQDIMVDAVIIHPEYNMFRQVNNIALVQMRTPANVNGLSVLPICINQQNQAEDSLLLISSWCGSKETGLSLIPKQYMMKRISPKDCTNLLSTYTLNLEDGIFCIIFKQEHVPQDNTEYAPSLRGSAGGLVYSVQSEGKVYLIGLLSYGPPYPAKLGEPYIVTSIAPFYNWLTEMIKSRINTQCTTTN